MNRPNTIASVILAIFIASVVGYSLMTNPAAQSSTPRHCGYWRLVDTPTKGLSSSFGGLTGATQVAAISNNNVWAVGTSAPTTAKYRPLALHWNGKTWTRMPTVAKAGGYSLSAVSASSVSNVWAAGIDGDDKALIERWARGRWVVTPSPHPGESSQVNALDALSTDNVWAVGQYYGYSGHRTLVEHWNGRRWKRVLSPSPSGIDNDLYGIWANTAADIWAVGSYGDGAKHYRQLIEHWNGSRWKSVGGPIIDTPSTTLYGLTGSSASNAWAVGLYSAFEPATSTIVNHALIEHWNGRRWSLSKPTGTPGVLDGVTTSDGRRVWAIGGVATASGGQTLVEYWNGKLWSSSTADNPAKPVDDFLGVGLTGQHLWAVGWDGHPTGTYPTRPLAEEYTQC